MKKTTETVWGTVKAYEVGKPDSLVTVLPKPLRIMLGLKKGDKFLVKTKSGEGNEIILEKIVEEPR
jgi:hypothetical protein